MPKVKVSDVELYYEETGSGFPVIFCHEFAGDYRSWEQQVRHFARRYRVITYNYRGYAPSDVPADRAAYSQEISDLRHARIDEETLRSSRPISSASRPAAMLR